MKLFTTSGIATLFNVLAPVIAMSIANARTRISVPAPGSNFSFLCENGRRYQKNYLQGAVQEARSIMSNQFSHIGYPLSLNHLDYDIPGNVWYHPLNLHNADDFVVFSPSSQIAGVATCETHPDGHLTFSPCSFI
ncbi:BgTH12-06055 [Blumeria graminis f. sp. triticale]|uniref:BgTH12-06055 n=1 Tax=Blumeria graminis f. sp. triticale TaxID=1689686 RepID=A0A9W4GG67_BLUGR|nr:BgTH12-06055 [Blumeria graminis f. sp. triticale]